MELTELEATWTALGEQDPFWAVLSAPEYKYGRWDVSKFFSAGDDEVRVVLDHLAAIGRSPVPGRCLEFGCGVGRCSNGLAKWFAEYDGVDISTSMLELARHYHEDPRVRYHHNTRDDLSIFDDESFDFVYSRLVLQHIPPPHNLRYISEFLRVLRPGGLAVFQIRACPRSFDPTMFRAHLELAAPILGPLSAGSESGCAVKVRNTSPTAWPAATVMVGNHWPERRDDGRTLLEGSLPSGAETVLDLRFVAPRQPGDYILEIDLVVDGVAWFADHGSPVLQVPVAVCRDSPGARLLQRLPRNGAWGKARTLAGHLRRSSVGSSPHREGTTDATDKAETPHYDGYFIDPDDVLAILESAGVEVVEVTEEGLYEGTSSLVNILYTVAMQPGSSPDSPITA